MACLAAAHRLRWRFLSQTPFQGLLRDPVTMTYCLHRNDLSGPDGSRHSSDQQPKDVNSENSNYCPEFVSGNFCPPEGKLPRCRISVFLQSLNFCHTSRETPEPPGDGNSDFLSFLSFVAISCSGFVWRHLRSRDTSGTLKKWLQFKFPTD